MSNSHANNPDVLTAYLGTVSTAGTYPLFYLPKNFIILGARVTDQNGVAADNTNYITLTLKQGATAIASYDSRAANQGALTANVSKAMVLDAAIPAGLVTNGAANEIPAGDYSMTYAEGGTGTTTLMQVQVYGYYK
jgi:hypothetical protein